ncbi:unnamed protein product [Clavelina lepadiformis]|uniref:Uncharacterized protein n=1 Tax=Clavelina lepadiformis TaxID=159417 RepID=A0ABP0H2C3_CLALP
MDFQDRLLQDQTGHQICSSLPGTYSTSPTDQTIWLDTSDVSDYVLLLFTTDLCKDSYRVNRPTERETSPMDGVHFSGVFLLPSRHTVCYTNYGTMDGPIVYKPKRE